VSKPPTPRMRKVNELIREVVAEEVTKLKDPRLGFITITAAETAPNLRSSTVFYSSIDGEDPQAALESASARLQGALARQARLKYTPVLSFEVDPAIEAGLRMSQLLDELRTEGEENDDGDSEALEDGSS
jgi:ribosome-binding factor A